MAEINTSPGSRPLSVIAKQAALDAALSSDTFSRADQLRQFLKWVCEQEIQDRKDTITEYSIGVEAMGRPTNFSPSEESSVRTRAHALRQKLREYYSREAPQSPVRIELPKGSYVPRFVEQQQEQEPELEPEPESIATPTRTVFARNWMWWLAVAGALVFGSLVTRIISTRSPVPSVVAEAWGPLAKDGEVVICVSNPGHLVVSGVPDGQPPARLHPIPDLEALAPPLMEAFPHWKREQLRAEFTTSSVRFGDAMAMALATKLLSQWQVPFRLAPVRTIGWPALSGRNLLLLGSPDFSLTARRLMDGAPYTIQYDTQHKDVAIIGQGKALVPKRAENNLPAESYGLITVRPSDGSPDGSTRTIVISGLTSAGAQAAIMYFTSAPELEALRQKMGGRFPAAYQVIVRCTAHEDMMLAYSFLTHAAYSVPTGDLRQP